MPSQILTSLLLLYVPQACADLTGARAGCMQASPGLCGDTNRLAHYSIRVTGLL